MNQKQHNHIVVFEHQPLRYDVGFPQITKEQFETLERFYKEGQNCPYYTLINHGVLFKEYVGVIQIGNFVIEVLPKADRNVVTKETETTWRNILIDMLRAVGTFEINATSNSNLKIKPNCILDLYLELFLNELEVILHTGLIKKYRKKESNLYALKGNLKFSKHIQQNLVHKERFYVSHTIYDYEHEIHQILYKALLLVKRINTNQSLVSSIGGMILNFPEMKDIQVTGATFEKMVFNRKNKHYVKAFAIAKILLMNYHPNLSQGNNNVLALMFDMNVLWEKFVYSSLKKSDEISVTDQVKKDFWTSCYGRTSFMLADIVAVHDGKTYIFDTKWKNIYDNIPSPEDLRQIFAYLHYYKANKAGLIYPGSKLNYTDGNYKRRDEKHENEVCSIITFNVQSIISEWQQTIREETIKWFKI